MKRYLNCPLLKHSVHFFYDNIRPCCSNVSGPIFYENYNGEQVVDWNKVYQERKKIVEKINNDEYEEGVPPECQGCCDIEKYLTTEKIADFPNTIERFYFQNNMSCNAKCSYCSFGYVGEGYKYKVIPLINSIIENNMMSESIICFMSGGEMTINPEFHDLLNILTNVDNSYIELFSSGIKYSEAIKNAFITNPKFNMVISLDSGTRKTYNKIKKVDCFDKVIDNLKQYTQATENAKNNIILKYILVDDVNDNIEEIKSFIDTVLKLGIKQVRMDVDFVKYKYEQHKKVPSHYFELFDEFHKIAKENNLQIRICDQSEGILDFARG